MADLPKQRVSGHIEMSETLTGTPRRGPCSVSDSLSEMSVPLASSGESLRWVRMTVGLSQSAMAKKAGLAEGTLSQIETDLVPPRPEQKAAILGAAMDELADLHERYAILMRYLRRSA